MVLPSIIKNIIIPNIQYKCDYYIHYYNKTIELYDRGIESGRTGMINPKEVQLLYNAVLDEYNTYFNLNSTTSNKSTRSSTINNPTIQFQMESEEQFFTKYKYLIERIISQKDDNNGEYLYLPWRHNFPNSTIENIIKTWHSQQAVWELMEKSIEARHSSTSTVHHTVNEQSSSNTPIRYSRAGMFRIDVMYVTPIDIYRISNNNNNNKIDYNNEYAIIPAFSRAPVNDRMIYGPIDAIQIWASGRFERLQNHGLIASSVSVSDKNKQQLWRRKRYGRYKKHQYQPGDGIHPETFIDQTIFPAIRDAGINILEYEPSQNLCFLRVRSDSSVRIADCGIGCVNDNNIKYVQQMLNHTCHLNLKHPSIPVLECLPNDIVPVNNLKQETTDDKKLVWQGCEWKTK